MHQDYYLYYGHCHCVRSGHDGDVHSIVAVVSTTVAVVAKRPVVDCAVEVLPAVTIRCLFPRSQDYVTGDLISVIN